MGMVDEDQEEKKKMIKRSTELSLGPSASTFAETVAGSTANGCRKKRKHTMNDEAVTESSIELQLNDPLPLDWEQCLDLQSGKVYYMDRKTMKKSSTRPTEQNLNLELNISTPPSSVTSSGASASATNSTSALVDHRYANKYSSPSSDMVAVACPNCHLLVVLCRSSPSCPNCRFVHAPLRRRRPTESSETLSLLR